MRDAIWRDISRSGILCRGRWSVNIGVEATFARADVDGINFVGREVDDLVILLNTREKS